MQDNPTKSIDLIIIINKTKMSSSNTTKSIAGNNHSTTNNTYSFDFLRSEHHEEIKPKQEEQEVMSSSSTARNHDVSMKTPLEKQFDIFSYLQNQRLKYSGHKFYSESEILDATGINLGIDLDVADMLSANPRIKTSSDLETGETTYAYQAKFQVSNNKELLALINRCKNGICAKDLRDCYANVEADLSELICSGEIIAIANSEVRDKTLFPRGEVFLVEMDGNVDVKYPIQPSPSKLPDESKSDPSSKKDLNETLSNSAPQYYVQTEKDFTKEIRRGEAVWVGGQWFRVSSAVRDGASLSEQPPRAQAPLSVTSIHDMSKKNEVDGYCRSFTKESLPVDRSMKIETLNNIRSGKIAKEELDKLGGPPPNSSTTSGSSVSVIRKRPTAASSSNANASSNIVARTAAAANIDLTYLKARRHGCSKDIREMYLETRNDVPESEVDLYRLLVGNKLLEEGEAMRRPRIRKKSDNLVNGKAKKKRYYVRKGHKITNTHLAGTEIGAVLAMASERQQQGKDVGDGGM